MTRMTDERLAEIDKLHSECTQGPYIPCPDKAYIFAPNSKMIASASYREKGVEDGTVELRGDGAGLPMDANHDFLVASWQIVKELREEVRALRGDVTEARDYARQCHAGRVLTCAFCGQAYPQGTPASEDGVLTAHIAVCEKHPMRAVEAELADLKNENALRDGGYLTALRIANGCTDYGGGYGGRDYEIYQHGIGTVIAALERAKEGDTQTAALIGMGAAALARKEHPMRVLNFGVQAEAAERTYEQNIEALRRQGCLCGEYAAVTGMLNPDCPQHGANAPTLFVPADMELVTVGAPEGGIPLVGPGEGGVVDLQDGTALGPAISNAGAVKKLLLVGEEARTGQLAALLTAGVRSPEDIAEWGPFVVPVAPPEPAFFTDRAKERCADHAALDTQVKPEDSAEVSQLKYALADARAQIAGLDESHPKCSCCGAIATCFGTYEGNANWGYGCDACCGHGCEDGRCTALESDSQIAAETAQKIAIENNKLDAELFELKKEKT